LSFVIFNHYRNFTLLHLLLNAHQRPLLLFQLGYAPALLGYLLVQIINPPVNLHPFLKKLPH